MCTVLAGALIGAATSVYTSNKAAAAQEEATQAQEEAAQKAATATPTASSETSTDVTAAVQANRRRVAAAQGLSSTITGAGSTYNTGSGATKSSLGS